MRRRDGGGARARISAWLSARTGAPCVAYAKDVRMEGGALMVSSQAYGGKLMAEIAPEGDMAIAACLAGSFPVEAGQGCRRSMLR